MTASSKRGFAIGNTCTWSDQNIVPGATNTNPIRLHYTATSTAPAICPDLLRLDDLGAADGWRGRSVRIFFRILAIVTGV